MQQKKGYTFRLLQIKNENFKKMKEFKDRMGFNFIVLINEALENYFKKGGPIGNKKS